MKLHKFISSFFYLFISSFLIIYGCATPNIKMPKSLPTIIKEYKHIVVYGDSTSINTGIYVNKGNILSVLATGKIDLGGGWGSFGPSSSIFFSRFGQNYYSFLPYGYAPDAGMSFSTLISPYSGYLHFGIRDEYPQNNVGSFSLDIIVWETDDWVQIADFFENMKTKDPQNETITHALRDINYFRTDLPVQKEDF